MSELPPIETIRLLIRPYELGDLAAVNRLFSMVWDEDDSSNKEYATAQDNTEWLQWTVLNYRHLAWLNQPTYGDRAITLKQTEELIGSCGYVPCLDAFEQLPGLGGKLSGKPGRNTPEVGLFYSISPDHRRQGYATEAANALVDYACQKLNLKRIIASTTFDNNGSIEVMRKLGMRVEKNPLPEPPWLQIVGVLENNG